MGGAAESWEPEGEPLNPKRALSLKLTITARQMHRRFDQSVTAIGITRSQWTLIAVITRHPGATQREVAELLEMSEAAAGRAIDRLCTEGLLMRKPKEDDRRAYCVHLTDAAGVVLEKIGAVATVHEEALFDDFSPEDLAQLDEYLDRLAANALRER